MFTFLEIKKPDDLAGLATLVSPSDFAAFEVVQWLQRTLSPAVGAMLVEYPYVDKDYRSTYYHYYAKKGSGYSPHSVRLHFFRAGWRLRDAPLALDLPGEPSDPTDAAVAEGYLGYVVLRPTRINTIGRTVLHPEAVRDASGWLIDHRHKAHVLGYRVHVNGFPFMQQHSDIAVCAHTACWAILRHYSERYALYREVLVHDISKLGKEFDPGGLVPSLGITARDAERIFAAVGTYPLLVVRASHERSQSRFHDELLAYLESGFPLFGVQSKRGHAVAITGYRREILPQTHGDAYKRRAWDFVSHLVVADDNHRPYLPVARAATAALDYSIDDFDAFIVPLPEKMFLPAAAAFEWSEELTVTPMDNFEELEQDKELVKRCFVTTTASWQRFVRQHSSQLPADFASVALELTMPQFIWVVEYATPAQRAKNQVQARLLLDATAGTHDPFPAFLIHNDRGALWVDRANRVPMQYQRFAKNVGSLSEMGSNLNEH